MTRLRNTKYIYASFLRAEGLSSSFHRGTGGKWHETQTMHAARRSPTSAIHLIPSGSTTVALSRKKKCRLLFFRFANLSTAQPVMLGDIGDIIHDLAGTRA